MNWSAVSDLIEAVAPVFTAGAACFGAFIAHRGLTKWHTETVGKRRIELAEEVLADFYQARDIIRAARSPSVTPTKASTEREMRMRRQMIRVY